MVCGMMAWVIELAKMCCSACRHPDCYASELGRAQKLMALLRE